MLPNPVADENRGLVARTAARQALPAIYAYRYYVTSGGLMSYGIDTDDQFKKAASYVDRILKVRSLLICQLSSRPNSNWSST